jgi:hypothetical protein
VAAPSLDDVRAIVLRLFIDAPGAALRKEDEQKCRELVGLLPLLGKLGKGAHVVDAAAGKASVGLVAAELFPIARLTVIERDPARVAACRAAAGRLSRQSTAVEVREADVGDPAAWPEGPHAPDAVVALHACGPAADLAIDGAIRCGARQVLVAPCCYGDAVPFRARAGAIAAAMGFADDDLLHRRAAASLVDEERKLRLEAAGFETRVEEFVAPTVSPHNLVFRGRRTSSEVRMARARERLAALRAGALSVALP